MSRPLCSLGLLLCLVSRSPAQQRPAPVYALPANGVWVEYRFESLSKDGKKDLGTLRISSVGLTTINEKAHRWLEFSLEIPKAKRKLRKLLVLEAGSTQTSWTDRIVEGYSSEGPGESVNMMSRASLRSFMSMGSFDQTLQEQKGDVSVVTGLGELNCRYVISRGSGSLEYRGWLVSGVPFGWAKFEIVEHTNENLPRVVFRATAHKSGAGAKSELDEAKAK